mmetsp:Transcript_79888/g.231898  ORF Transcript_79888/g.231898 Transcript_79888/m.231898 type:complete len:273 (+) Transcript_79888:153-971(+)
MREAGRHVPVGRPGLRICQAGPHEHGPWDMRVALRELAVEGPAPTEPKAGGDNARHCDEDLDPQHLLQSRNEHGREAHHRLHDIDLFLIDLAVRRGVERQADGRADAELVVAPAVHLAGLVVQAHAVACAHGVCAFFPTRRHGKLAHIAAGVPAAQERLRAVGPEVVDIVELEGPPHTRQAVDGLLGVGVVHALLRVAVGEHRLERRLTVANKHRQGHHEHKHADRATGANEIAPAEAQHQVRVAVLRSDVPAQRHQKTQTNGHERARRGGG